jgi:aryl-alcohol dehydrogenase-like predicted oxidoreductase/spore coat polysaccharide biosynthesis protein SpsF (cytidylyltransferase family)
MTADRRVRIVIQARLSSSRLPAKALIDVGGIPVSALVALRAANRGHDTVVATSVDQTDDPLVAALEGRGIRVVRGPLADTLARYAIATSDLDDDDVVVRLTADNVVPDGDLVAGAVERMLAEGAVYWRHSDANDDVPYGVSVEVFTAGVLREADGRASSAFDREHVTPWIRRAHARADERDPGTGTYGRSTLDNFDDLVMVLQVLDGIDDPVTAPWRDLATAFADRTGRPQVPVRSGHPALVLGTAQLGMDYGIANRSGMPAEDDARVLLAEAVARGVRRVDTAAAYGRAESRIGAFLARGYRDRLAVTTKVVPLAGIDDASLAATVTGSVMRSAARLGIDPDLPNQALDTVLLHLPGDAMRGGGAPWRELRRLQDEGVVSRIGVSVQHPSQALAAADLDGIGAIQLPFNLLDARWDEAGAVLAGAPGIAVTARSVLLQGLLSGTVPADAWPTAEGFSAADAMRRLDDLTRELGRTDTMELAIAYVLGQGWIDDVVIGCESAAQLDGIVRRVSTRPLDADEIGVVRDAIGDVPPKIIDPTTWEA